jgi:probable phosphoglycerate mutase
MDSYRGDEVFRQPGREDTVILLIRHAHTDALGVRLAGRAPGIPLSAIGPAQLPALRHALASHTLSAIDSSPIERAFATARAVADAQRVPVREHEGLTEVDFGDWTGKTFEELARLERVARVQHPPRHGRRAGGRRARCRRESSRRCRRP